MALRFFFDECANEHVAQALTAAGLDVVTASSLGRKGLPDEDQLRFARQENRVLYTVDPDYLQHAADFIARGEAFAGIAYHAAAARTVRQIIDALILLDGVLDAAGMANHVEYI
jgi:hypothetical protein